MAPALNPVSSASSRQGAGFRLLALLERAGRKLQQLAVDGVAVLADPEDAALGVHGDEDDRAGVLDHLAAHVEAVRDLNRVDPQLDDAAFVDVLRADEDGIAPAGHGWSCGLLTLAGARSSVSAISLQLGNLGQR